ncbi:MAG: hypothetical protein ACLP50_28180 [Solirubrobacteraceae bacterium]
MRVAFLHPPRRGGGSGPLAQFVRGRRSVALDLLLLTHALRPLTEADEIAAPASDWAQALGIAGRPGSRAMISRSWSWLQDQKLISSRTLGQLRSVTALREDGSGRPWELPWKSGDVYFKLPAGVWRDGLWTELSLPGKAVFLIGLSLESRDKSSFQLPLERGAEWYGITARTVRNGLRELKDAGLIHQTIEKRETPKSKSPIGYRHERHYSLDDSVTPREVAVGREQRLREAASGEAEGVAAPREQLVLPGVDE